MSGSELAHLELLAEIDALVERLNRWAEAAPAWRPAEKCRALVRRLTDRAVSLRVRLDAPLVVATLGGTGTGKSALVNALLGAEVVQTGRSRPTTTRPTLICRPGVTPDMLDIDPSTVELIERDLPALRDLVVIDCPDADTTENEPAEEPSRASQRAASNLARLRAILPKCDVLLVTATQQKYRSARVADELAAAACGVRWSSCKPTPIWKTTSATIGGECSPKGRGDRTKFSASIRSAHWPRPRPVCSRAASSPICSICLRGRWPARRAIASAG